MTGAPVGDSVGLLLGASDGDAVGLLVGGEVGAGVGSGPKKMSPQKLMTEVKRPPWFCWRLRLVPVCLKCDLAVVAGLVSAWASAKTAMSKRRKSRNMVVS